MQNCPVGKVIMYPTKKAKHKVLFIKFLENNNKFRNYIYTDLKCVNRTKYPMNFTRLDSIHLL